jgi:galactoside O-acetyltransferase
LGNLITQKKGSIIQISNNVYMGNSALISSKRISIGNNVLISAGSLITDNDGHSLNYMVRKNDVSNRLKGYKNWRQIREKAIRIEKNSWIGYGCIILKGVTIGEGSIVGAGSVVTTSVPPFTVVGGNPAKIIKKINK